MAKTTNPQSSASANGSSPETVTVPGQNSDLSPLKSRLQTTSVAVICMILLLFLIGAVIFARKGTRVNPAPVKQNIPSSVTQLEGALPEDFPDFPVYPDASLTNSQITKATPNQPGVYQEFLSSDSKVADIIAWYVQYLSTAGWTIVRMPDETTPTDQNIVASNTKFKLTINVEKEDAESTISVYLEDR